MNEETETKGSWLKSLWKWATTPKPSGPCKYCGAITYDHNTFNAAMFRCDWCWEKELQRRQQEEDDRRQIDLYKRAIKEIQQETKP